ncbi:PepSY-associated TM helix domain-containing protein [Acinetobacter haemolyticus]|uniref:PepSY-associated TM helix domain-containing protein n=1 Tax=Acinetobacter haemolyticus TaxID=29430 RepID=UPI002DBB1ED2|nr:PepSY-associated TM helix domain-containing protein [Acinetobacter haemolyticus]MEB6675831.1 PepSY domain-containing protein [Acinetobacter haemolyticus]
MKVRADIIKLGKNLHTWVGISAGILLFICFFAGGLTMFQHHLSQWASPPVQRLAPLENHQYNQLVHQAQAQYPETRKGFTLSFSSLETHNAPMQWEAAHDEEEEDHHHIDIAQTTMMATLDSNGKLLVQQENVSKLGWLIEQLHETAGIPGMIGHHTAGVMVMGVVAVLYFLAIMSGLIVLLPTLISDYFAVRKGKNKKRFWLDTHNVIGITSLPFHIIISVTVVVFAFHDIFYGTLAKVTQKPLFERPAPTQIVETSPQLDVEQIFANIQKVAPDYRIDAIRFGNLDNPQRASAFVALYHPDRLLRGDTFDYMTFNPYQSTPYSNQTLSTEESNAASLIRSMFSLHFGNYGGDPIRWIYVLFGLGGAYLFYSGNILWIETRLRKQKNPNLPPPQQRKDVMFIANLTIGACLGCMLAIFSSMLIGRWGYVITPQLQSHNHVFMYSYYLVFLGSLIYSFVIGAARALPHLFLAIAVVLLLIPVTSLIAYLFPIQGLWYSTGSLIWIDIIAVVFALLFLRFYQQANDRAQSAPIGSIWSIQKVDLISKPTED